MKNMLLRARVPLGQLGDLRLGREDLRDLAGQPRAGPATIRWPSANDRSRTRPRCRRQQRERDRHVGERLGGGHRDLGAGVQVDAAVARAGDRAADDVDHAQHPAALALQLLHGGERVERLAGLADRDVQRVRVDHRVAVAELRGRLGVGGQPGQLLDQPRAELARVVGRAAAEDLHPADRAQPRARRGSRPPRCAVANRSSSRPRSARSTASGCSRDLLVHEVRRGRRARSRRRSQSTVVGLPVDRPRLAGAGAEVRRASAWRSRRRRGRRPAGCAGPARPRRRRRTSRFSPMPMTTGLPLRARPRSVRAAAASSTPGRRCPRPAAASSLTASSSESLRPRAPRAIRWASTSVSVSEAKHDAVGGQLGAQPSAFSMMPLCTTATRPLASSVRVGVDVVRLAVRGPAGMRDARGRR